MARSYNNGYIATRRGEGDPASDQGAEILRNLSGSMPGDRARRPPHGGPRSVGEFSWTRLEDLFAGVVRVSAPISETSVAVCETLEEAEVDAAKLGRRQSGPLFLRLLEVRDDHVSFDAGVPLTRAAPDQRRTSAGQEGESPGRACALPSSGVAGQRPWPTPAATRACRRP